MSLKKQKNVENTTYTCSWKKATTFIPISWGSELITKKNSTPIKTTEKI